MLSKFTNPKQLLEQRILEIRDHPSNGENEVGQIARAIETLIKHAMDIHIQTQANTELVGRVRLSPYIYHVILKLLGFSAVLSNQYIMNDVVDGRFITLTDLHAYLVMVDAEIGKVQLSKSPID